MGDRKIAALFKLSYALVQAFATVRKKRITKDREEGYKDFN